MTLYEKVDKAEGGVRALRAVTDWLAATTVAIRALEFRLIFRQHGLHHQAAGAGIDHAEAPQREQGKRLHRLPRARRIVDVIRRERTDQPFEQHADQRRSRKTGVLLRQMAPVDGRADARFDLAGKLAAIKPAHRVGFDVDRLGDHRPGELAVAQRPRPKRSDGGDQRRQRSGRGVGGLPHRRDLALGDAFDQAPTSSILPGK